MPPFLRPVLAFLAALPLTGVAPAQTLEPPTPAVASRLPTPQDLSRREARKLYALAQLRVRQDRLVDAARLLEEARGLDPDALPIHKALIPLYIALCRTDDVAATCRKVLDADPEDYETWQVYGRQLRARHLYPEARDAFRKALACPQLHELPEVRVQLHHDVATLSEDLKDYPAAVAAFGEVAKILEKPETLVDVANVNRDQLLEQASATSERIGKICLETKQYAEAEKAFRHAQALFLAGRNPDQQPSPLDAYRRTQALRLDYNLAKVCLARQKPGDALSHLNAYLRTQPQGAEAYELLVTVLKQLGRAREIPPALQQYAAADRHNGSLKLLLARQYAEAGQPLEAERLYLERGNLAPSAEVYEGLFAFYAKRREVRKILDLLNKAIQKGKNKDGAPGDAQASAQARAMLQVLRDDAALARALVPVAHRAAVQREERLAQELLYFLATLATRNNQLAEAERFFRDSLDGLQPGSSSESAVYGGLLRVLWQARKYEEVAALCRQGIRQAQATSLMFLHYRLSQALMLLGRTDEALHEADRAIALAAPDQVVEARLNRAHIWQHADRGDLAVAECLKLLRDFKGPRDARDIRITLSSIYSEMRDLPRAEEQLQLILQADPQDALAANNLGYLWADHNKNLAEAERLIRRALDLDAQRRKTVPALDDDRENAAYVDSLGWVLFRRGQLDEARALLEKASALPDGADDPVVWDHLGDVYARLGQPAPAAEAWRKAQSLYEVEKRRKVDDRLKELKQKRKLLEATEP